MLRKDLDQIFRLLSKISKIELYRNKRKSKQSLFQRIFNYVIYLQALFFFLAVATWIGYVIIGDYIILKLISLSCIIIIYLIFLVAPFLIALVLRRDLCSAIKNPIKLLFDNTYNAARIDSLLLNQLKRYSIDLLEFLLLELNAEKEFFHRRVSVIIGPIEKIGLLPGIVTVGISIYNFKTDQPEWLTIFTYALAFLYLFGVEAHFNIMRLERYAKLTELALERKKLREFNCKL